MNQLNAKSQQKLNWQTSIVDLMKLVGMDSSLLHRKELAAELGYTGDTNDSAAMNIWLHKAVMQKLAANGGKVPANLAGLRGRALIGAFTWLCARAASAAGTFGELTLQTLRGTLSPFGRLMLIDGNDHAHTPTFREKLHDHLVLVGTQARYEVDHVADREPLQRARSSTNVPRVPCDTGMLAFFMNSISWAPTAIMS